MDFGSQAPQSAALYAPSNVTCSDDDARQDVFDIIETVCNLKRKHARTFAARLVLIGYLGPPRSVRNTETQGSVDFLDGNDRTFSSSGGVR